MDTRFSDIQRHYSQGGLLERILGALQAAGKDVDALTHEELAPVDEFHTGGRRATQQLAELGGLGTGMRVLDLGSGLGGPARFLAAQCGCEVTGIDLQPEFCAVAGALSERCGLAARTQFRQGNALELPFADGDFDAVWTIQVQMNIADKARLYGEVARVLRPGGRFVFQDICCGDGRALHFPVPWATRPDQSFLVTPDEMRALIGQAGLREKAWRDISEATIAWRKAHAAHMAAEAQRPGAPALNLGLVMGDQAPAKMANSARCVEEGRTRSVQGVYEKPL